MESDLTIHCSVKQRKHSRTMMKKRGTIIKEKERNQERREKTQEKLILSKSAEESELLRDKIAPLSSSPGASKERSALSKSMGETTSTKLLRSSAKTREMPEAHRLAKAGDVEGLLKLVHEQGRSTVLRTLDWRGQTVLHIAIDNNNRALAQRLIELYPDQIEADLNLRDNNGWSPIHVAAGTRVSSTNSRVSTF
jgi:ankyrin repeat protein